MSENYPSRSGHRQRSRSSTLEPQDDYERVPRYVPYETLNARDSIEEEEVPSVSSRTPSRHTSQQSAYMTPPSTSERYHRHDRAPSIEQHQSSDPPSSRYPPHQHSSHSPSLSSQQPYHPTSPPYPPREAGLNPYRPSHFTSMPPTSYSSHQSGQSQSQSHSSSSDNSRRARRSTPAHYTPSPPSSNNSTSHYPQTSSDAVRGTGSGTGSGSVLGDVLAAFRSSPSLTRSARHSFMVVNPNQGRRRRRESRSRES